jgi:CheY-like chemotaxis protein
LLLVEDNAPAIIQLTEILQAQGYQIEVAHDGREALARIEHSVPDAMILDLMMPGVDGFQVLAALRNDPRTAQVPVLILTAKHVSRGELALLKGNHIYQLIQKGDVNKHGLLAAVASMVAPPHAQPAPPPLRRRPTHPGKALVLVVEDNLDNLRTVRALLSEHYRIVEAEDGQAAVELAQLHQPDLILTDLALPVMDGFAALATIRQDPLLCDIPVIAVTATAMKGNREEILARGFDGYLSKPIDHDALLRILRGFLE